MIVKMDITHIEPSYDSISSEIEKSKIPGCFGAMHLPLLKNIIDVEFEDLFVPRESTDPSAIHQMNTIGLIPQYPDMTKGMGLTKQGYNMIAQHKQEQVNAYLSQCAKCNSCDVFNRCYMLTQNSLRTIQLTEELYKND